MTFPHILATFRDFQDLTFRSLLLCYVVAESFAIWAGGGAPAQHLALTVAEDGSPFVRDSLARFGSVARRQRTRSGTAQSPPCVGFTAG